MSAFRRAASSDESDLSDREEAQPKLSEEELQRRREPVSIENKS